MVEPGQLQQEPAAQGPAGRPPLPTVGFDECAGEWTHRALSSSRAWVWPITVLRMGCEVRVDKTRLAAAAQRFGLRVPPSPRPLPVAPAGSSQAAPAVAGFKFEASHPSLPPAPGTQAGRGALGRVCGSPG